MPYSAEEGQSLMMSWIKAQSPRSVLDIGAGSGTYGKLVRAACPDAYRIGVEVWHPYVARFNLTDVYDQVVHADVRDMWGEPPIRADVVILGDVLEHMHVEDATRVWRMALDWARKAVYLSIPITPYPQGECEGNPFEAHVVPDYTDERVLATFEGITWKWLGTIVGRYEAVVK
jgi:hypothetical protein